MSRKNEANYTECKTFGHGWERFNPLVPRTGDVTISLRCIRCATERYDYINRHTGELVDREYAYPKDYKSVGIKLTKDELRMALIKSSKGNKVTKLRAVS